MSEPVFNVGVIGYGLSAKVFHIPFIKLTPSLRLHSIVQRRPTPGASAPEDYPTDVKHQTSADDLFADPDVHVVVVTTPPDTHFSLTLSALKAGKHVLTEKPFVPTSDEADKLIAASREANRLICVYQNRRWDADFQLVKRLLSASEESSQLGRILEYESHFDRYRPGLSATAWKQALGIPQGGSAIFDLGTHLFDQAFHLFGAPSTVFGRLLNQREGSRVDTHNPDTVYAQLYYEATGLIVHIRISVFSAETKQPRFWIRGTKGSFHKYDLDPQEDQLKGGMEPTHPDFGKDDPNNVKLFTASANSGGIEQQQVPETEPATYKAFYAEFAKAVASNKEADVPVPATEARDVLKIIEAVVESASTGKNVTFKA
jgi:predicted dehydrogenase